MRQAGIIAAGALYALDHHRPRLAEDHENAKALAEGIAGLPGIELDVDGVETNILIVRVSSMPATELAARLQQAGVSVLATGPDTIRAVTHMDVGSSDIAAAVEVFRDVLATSRNEKR